MGNSRFRDPKRVPLLVRDFGLEIVSSSSLAAHFLALFWGPAGGPQKGPLPGPKKGPENGRLLVQFWAPV